MAYVLGFFAADGNMHQNKRGAFFIEIQIADKKILESMRLSIGSNHKITVRKPKNPKWKTQYRLQIGSKSIFEDLQKLGMTPRKSKTLIFPLVPQKYLGDFIRGYFDGDGNVHLGCYWRKDRRQWKSQFTSRFTSGSKTFLEQLWHALRGCVQGGYLYQKNRGYELVFAQHDSVALFKLMYNNIQAQPYLERKHKIFLKAFQVFKMRA